MKRAGKAVWRRQAHDVFDMDAPGASHLDLQFQSVCFEVVNADSCDRLSALAAQAISWDADVRDYLVDIRRGRAIGLFGHTDGRLVHYAFILIQNKTAAILGIGAERALIGNAFTVPDCRGRGLQGRSVALRAAIARELGFSGVAAETHPTNLASQRGLLRGGMAHFGRMELIVLLNCIVLRWRRPAGFALLGLCIGMLQRSSSRNPKCSPWSEVGRQPS